MATKDPWDKIDPRHERERTEWRDLLEQEAAAAAVAVARPGAPRRIEDAESIEEGLDLMMHWSWNRPLGVAMYSVWMWIGCAFALLVFVGASISMALGATANSAALGGAAVMLGIGALLAYFLGRGALMFWRGTPKGWSWVFALTALFGLTAIVSLVATLVRGSAQAASSLPAGAPPALIYSIRIVVAGLLVGYLFRERVRAYCKIALPGETRAIVRGNAVFLFFLTALHAIRQIL